MKPASSERAYRRFTRVNRNVWLVFLAISLWGFIRYEQGYLPITPGTFAFLFLLGMISPVIRTVIGVRNPTVLYSFTTWLAVYDLLVISVAVWATGGFESEVWLLYFPLLVSEVAVMPRKWLVRIVPLAIGFYTLASLPLPNTDLVNLLLRDVMLGLISVFVYQVHRTHLEHQDELADLREKVQLGQERERIAREFHDGLGHALINSIMGLEVTRYQLKDSTSGASDLIDDQIRILRGALDETRQVILQLHGTEMGNSFQRLRLLARQLEERLQVPVHLNLPQEEPELSPKSELVLTRIVQEAMNNILKHAQGVRCVQANLTIQDNRLTCEVYDDGVGFDPQLVLGGFGLRHMADRVASLGGEFQIESAPQGGTRVSFWIPYTDS